MKVTNISWPSRNLRWRDTENTRERGMQDFLDDKKYRPGLTAVERAK